MGHVHAGIRPLDAQSCKLQLGPLLWPICYITWIYFSAAFHYTIADCHEVSKDAVCSAVYEVTDLIVEKLLKQEARFPTEKVQVEQVSPFLIICHRHFVNSVNNESRIQVARGFYSCGKIPSVCGCVDETLIPIKAPPGEIESQFVDRHGHNYSSLL